VHSDTGKAIVSQLNSSSPVTLIDGKFYLQRSADDSRVSVHYFWQTETSGPPDVAQQVELRLADTLSSVRGFADVLYRIRDAMPQLFRSAGAYEEAQILVPFISYAGQGLAGVNLRSWAPALSSVLGDLRTRLIVTTPARPEPWCFARDQDGSLVACTTFAEWVSRTVG